MADVRRDLLTIFIEPVRSSAPAFSSAEIGTVNGYTVVVTFNKNISASNYGTGVTIKVNTISTSITSATRQSNHAVVRYVIPIPYHGSGDTITWEYNAAVGNIVAESGAVVLANVSAQTVTNNITWAALLDLQADTGVTTSVTGFAGTGTAAQLDNDITGVGTAFLSEVVVGDVITGTGINGTVTAIASNANLTLSSSATAGAVSYTITPQAASSRVTTWIDQSGSSHNFTAAGTARPSKKTISSYSAIVFNGEANALAGGNFANNLSSFSVLTIAKFNGTGNDIVVAKSDGGTFIGWIVSASGNQIDTFDGAAGGILVFNSDIDKALFGVRTIEVINATTAIAHVYANGNKDNEQDLSAAPVGSYSSVENVNIGWLPPSGGSFIDIRVVMIFTPSPPAADRAALETRLGARYGITVP